MIKYNGNNAINDWKLGDINITKAYHNGSVCYQKMESGSTPPTPTFDGKWLATYTTGTSYADCDGTSAITSGEVATANLVAVEIGDCVTSIGNSAFTNTISLTSVTIPSSVTTIGEWAFSYCTSLTSIDILDSVTSIGAYAFYECSGLTSITIPNYVTSINFAAFSYCTSLTSIDIPSGVTSIGVAAFYGCSGLSSVTIPDSVTSIGDYAFYECTSLTSVTINATTPPTLGNDVFFNTPIADGNGWIYVPDESVIDYQTNWNEYGSQIRGISEL